jgi:hypothetical protein
MFIGAAFLLVVGCEEGSSREVARVTVDGFLVVVQKNDRAQNSYRAYAGTFADRVSYNSDTRQRNITAIERVAGCSVIPEMVRHEEPGTGTQAVTEC